MRVEGWGLRVEGFGFRATVRASGGGFPDATKTTDLQVSDERLFRPKPRVRTGSWMGPPQRKRVPRLGTT